MRRSHCIQEDLTRTEVIDEIAAVRIRVRPGSLFTTGLNVFWIVAVMVAASAIGCGGSPTTPTPPVTPPTPPAPPTPPVQPSAFSLTGRVVSSATGLPVAGARVVPEVGDPVITAADGTFQFASATNPQFTPYKMEVTADGYVTHNAYVRWERTRTGVDIDLFPTAPPFSLDFFRQLVRNGYEKPDELQMLRRLNASPSLYIRTVDDAGRTIDPQTLGLVESMVRKSVQAFSGGALSVAGVEMGATARPRTAGWLTIEFVDQPDATFCGTAHVGVADGLMTLNYNNCGCGGRRIAPSIIVHETGHAMGFWHVRDRGAIMSPVYDNPCSDDQPTATELFHAQMAYRRVRGNRDPDQDHRDGALALPGLTAPDVVITCPLR
jgi:hypothetical protein